MKKTLLYIFTIIFLFSCGSDYGNTEENHIKLPEAINFFSNEFKSASKIVFESGEGETIEMLVNTDDRIASIDIRGEKKYLENIYISMNSEESPYYPILLQGTGLFQQSNTDIVSPLLLISYMYGGLTDDVLVTSLNINNPELELGETTFHKQITLNNKVFYDVYSEIREGHEAYSDFYYSKKKGVVAFSDENNDLWVYDKIIE